MKDNNLKKILQRDVRNIPLNNFNDKVFESLKIYEARQDKKRTKRVVTTFNNNFLLALLFVVTILVSISIVYGHVQIATAGAVFSLFFTTYFIFTDVIISKNSS